jgi:hypothetical protein
VTADEIRAASLLAGRKIDSATARHLIQYVAEIAAQLAESNVRPARKVDGSEVDLPGVLVATLICLKMFRLTQWREGKHELPSTE